MIYQLRVIYKNTKIAWKLSLKLTTKPPARPSSIDSFLSFSLTWNKLFTVFIGNFEQVTLYYNIRGFNSKKPIYRSVSNCKQGSLKQSYFRWIFGSTETTKHCIVVTYRNQMSFERINSFIRKKPKEAKRMQDCYPPWINHSIKKLSTRKTFLHEVAKRDVLRETFKTHFA